MPSTVGTRWPFRRISGRLLLTLVLLVAASNFAVVVWLNSVDTMPWSTSLDDRDEDYGQIDAHKQLFPGVLAHKPSRENDAIAAQGDGGVGSPDLGAGVFRGLDVIRKRWSRGETKVEAADVDGQVQQQEHPPLSAVEAEVTFGIKTTGFHLDALRAIESIRKFYPRARILVADDGGYDEIPYTFVGLLKHDPLLEYHLLPFDAGLSAGRNFLVSRTQTPYFMVVDDDFVFTEDTRVERLLEVSELHDIDIVAASVGDRKGMCNRFSVQDHVLLLVPDGSETVAENCIRCEFVANFFLARTCALREVTWDPVLKLAEHEDMFLRLRAAGVSVALCPDIVVRHLQRASNARHARVFGDGQSYDSMRKRASELIVSVVLPKHSLRGMGYLTDTKQGRAFGNVTEEWVRDHILRWRWTTSVKLNRDEAFFPPRCAATSPVSVVDMAKVKTYHMAYCEDVSQFTQDDIMETDVYINMPQFHVSKSVVKEIENACIEAVAAHNAEYRLLRDVAYSYSRWRRADKRFDRMHGTEYQLEMEASVGEDPSLVTGRPAQSGNKRNAGRATVVLKLSLFRSIYPGVLSAVTAVTTNEDVPVYFVLPITCDNERLGRFLSDITQLHSIASVTLIVVVYPPGEFKPLEMQLRRARLRSEIVRMPLDNKFSRAGGLQAGLDRVPSNDSIVFFVDADIIMPQNFAEIVRNRVIMRRQVYMPVVFSFLEGRSHEMLLENNGWNTVSVYSKYGWWRKGGMGMLGAFAGDIRFVGGYNVEAFKTRWGSEDTDMARRLMHAGYKIARPLEPFYWHSFHAKRGWGGLPDNIAPPMHDAGGGIGARDQVDAPPRVKIYVYDLPKEFRDDVIADNQNNLGVRSEKFKMGRDEYDCLRNMFSIEVYMKEFIEGSPFHARNASNANFFYVPVPSVCHMNNALPFNSSRSGDFHRRLIDHISQMYPYWNRHQGADHVFVASQGRGRALFQNSRLFRNTIVLTVNGDRANTAAYDMMRDIVIPPYISDMDEQPGYDGRGDPSDVARMSRVFFMGSTKDWMPAYSGGVRQYIRTNFANLGGWSVVSRVGMMTVDLRDKFKASMRGSQLSLCPEGLYPYTPRVKESALAGTVPVILSRTLVHPFESALDYRSFAVWAPQAGGVPGIEKLPALLEQVDDAELAAKRRNLVRAAKALTYHKVAVEGDALHMIAAELANVLEKRAASTVL